MSNIQEITKFVESVFDLYQLDKNEFFYVYDEYITEKIPVQLFPFGEPDDETLREITSRIGLTKEEIIGMDEKAARKYWNKYPFFRLHSQYVDTRKWNHRFIGEMPTAEEVLMRAIFTEENPLGKRRYDGKELCARLVDMLKEMDKVSPGTYHEGAEITNLQINTQEFFSFPQCGDMIRSFLDIVRRTEELFFAAIHEELCTEDANELNFLASWLKATDIVIPSAIMTYDNVRTYRKAYLEEDSSDFFSYVRIRNFIDDDPWCCREFFDDMELVHDFFHVFPYAKANMRRSALETATFSCSFVWSDAEDIDFEKLDIDAMLERLSLPLDVRRKEWTHVYLSKRPEETEGCSELCERLRVASGPSGQGGIAVPARRYVNLNTAPGETVKKIQRRVNAKRGGVLNG